MNYKIHDFTSVNIYILERTLLYLCSVCMCCLKCPMDAKHGLTDHRKVFEFRFLRWYLWLWLVLFALRAESKASRQDTRLFLRSGNEVLVYYFSLSFLAAGVSYM